jgi:hypothetical protein
MYTRETDAALATSETAEPHAVAPNLNSAQFPAKKWSMFNA